MARLCDVFNEGRYSQRYDNTETARHSASQVKWGLYTVKTISADTRDTRYFPQRRPDRRLQVVLTAPTTSGKSMIEALPVRIGRRLHQSRPPQILLLPYSRSYDTGAGNICTFASSSPHDKPEPKYNVTAWVLQDHYAECAHVCFCDRDNLQDALDTFADNGTLDGHKVPTSEMRRMFKAAENATDRAFEPEEMGWECLGSHGQYFRQMDYVQVTQCKELRPGSGILVPIK